MHVRDLAELAALTAIHARSIVSRPGGVPHTTSEQYWTACKCRLERWFRLLKALANAAEDPRLLPSLPWPRVRPVLEEILVSELLTRIWTATAVAHDVARGDQDLEPVARNIYSAHLDARRRLFVLLSEGRALQLPHSQHLDQLRRRVERWGDLLLAHLSDLTDIQEFAFEPARARDFAEDLDREALQAETQFTCQLVVNSVRGSFAQGLAARSPNSDLNRQIGAALLPAIYTELGDASGLVKSLWLERISRTASDTETMIDELLRLEAG